jgi:hypothetical protein
VDTKIKVVGGSYFDKKDLLWHGELSLFTTGIGTKIALNKDDNDFLLAVTGVCIEISGKDVWQVLYVQPADKSTEKLLLENGSGVPKEVL